MSDQSTNGSDSRKRKFKNDSYDYTSEPNGNHGRWTAEEHQMFLEAINQFGREWDKVQAVVKTRSLAQVRSHAQKYFLKLSKNEEMEKLNEYEMWSCSRENNNVLMVLELMGSILKKLKTKRDEMLSQSSFSTLQETHCTNSSNNSQCARSDLDSHHDNDRFYDLQKAIEQLDAKTYNDVLDDQNHRHDSHLETETDHEKE